MSCGKAVNKETKERSWGSRLQAFTRYTIGYVAEYLSMNLCCCTRRFIWLEMALVDAGKVQVRAD